ncbi:MAG TPA: hypothetical protein VGF61_01705 [Candidatus Acidoferrum sp.]|jgi:hypothetical protein
MLRKPSSLLAYCTILLLIATNALARPKETNPRTKQLILSVFNDASVPAGILAQAEARATHILAQAGIQVEWLNCAPGGSHVPDQFEQPSPCSRIAYPSHLSVRIVLTAQSVPEDIFGQAFADNEGKGTYIKLFYAHLAEPNAHLPLGEGELLGCVIAHEVGHLLLGTDSHSRDGIMQGRWESPQLSEAGKGNLQFTPSQAALMRECLAGAKKKEPGRTGD